MCVFCGVLSVWCSVVVSGGAVWGCVGWSCLLRKGEHTGTNHVMI